MGAAFRNRLADAVLTEPSAPQTAKTGSQLRLNTKLQPLSAVKNPHNTEIKLLPHAGRGTQESEFLQLFSPFSPMIRLCLLDDSIKPVVLHVGVYSLSAGVSSSALLVF